MNQDEKKYLDRKVDEAIDDRLNAGLNVFNVPLKSNYTVLSFEGDADGTPLVQRFNNDLIETRNIIIKSFRIIPYYRLESVDIWLDDGVNPVTTETLPANTRCNRIFDDFVFGTTIVFLINGSTVNWFAGANGYNLDLWLDNIFYKYPAAVQNMAVSVNSRVLGNVGGLASPNVKVLIECYIA